MSAPLFLEDKVTIKVAYTFPDAAGVERPYHFTLTVDRLDTEEIKLVHDSGDLVFVDFFAKHASAWSGLKEGGANVEFSEANLRQLFKQPGIPLLTWQRYCEAIPAKGAAAKN